MTAQDSGSPLSKSDWRIPGYLGRVLYEDGVAAGTCFQAAPGVLVTAAHVLHEVEAGYLEAVVRVDALAGGLAAFEATVARVDEVHDLAVLTAATALPGSVPGWAATDVIEPNTEIIITGVSEVPDPRHHYRYLDAPGTWAGGTTRDGQVHLGRVHASSVMKGMSGAPVRRCSDDFVVGVVSERYNTADDWARDTVFVARVEDLRPLLEESKAVNVHAIGSSVREGQSEPPSTVPQHWLALTLVVALGTIAAIIYGVNLLQTQPSSDSSIGSSTQSSPSLVEASLSAAPEEKIFVFLVVNDSLCPKGTYPKAIKGTVEPTGWFSDWDEGDAVVYPLTVKGARNTAHLDVRCGVDNGSGKWTTTSNQRVDQDFIPTYFQEPIRVG